MHRREWQALSRVRRSEAEALLRASEWSGAYYLTGYAVECGLKAVIARQFRASTIPAKAIINQVHTHSLVNLVRLAGLEAELASASSASSALDINWAVTKDWNEQSRYAIWAERNARDLHNAAFARIGGVMGWVRKQW